MQDNINVSLKEKIVVQTIIALTLIYFILPFLIYRENSFIEIHDNLDQILPWINYARNNNSFFEHLFNLKSAHPFLNDISNVYVPSYLQIYTILIYVFGPFYGYLLNYILKIIAGYFSTKLFLSKCIFKNKTFYSAIKLISIAYAVLPFFPELSIGAATIPLFAYFIISIMKNPKSRSLYLFFILYPFISDLFRYGIFLLFITNIILIIKSITMKRFQWNLFIAIVLLSSGYIIVSYKLFYLVFILKEETTRIEFVNKYVPFFTRIRDTFLWGQYHSSSLHTFVILPLVLFTLIIKNIILIKKKKYSEILHDKFNRLFLINFLFILTDVLYYNRIINPMINLIPVIRGINIGRFLWLTPFTWFLLYAMALFFIFELLKNHRLIIALCTIQILFIAFSSSLYNDSFKTILIKIKLEEIRPATALIAKISSKIQKFQNTNLTFNEFFSSELFDIIKKEINYQNEKSAAVGFHPAVLSYNGITTLDGYLNIYPLEYKHLFRKLIQPELEKNEQYKNYFDNWGSRAYLFNKNVDFKPVQNISKDEILLNINPVIFNELKGKYIFSRVSISNYRELNLQKVNHFRLNNSPYTIHVYQNKGN